MLSWYLSLRRRCSRCHSDSLQPSHFTRKNHTSMWSNTPTISSTVKTSLVRSYIIMHTVSSVYMCIVLFVLNLLRQKSHLCAYLVSALATSSSVTLIFTRLCTCWLTVLSMLIKSTICRKTTQREKIWIKIIITNNDDENYIN